MRTWLLILLLGISGAHLEAAGMVLVQGTKHSGIHHRGPDWKAKRGYLEGQGEWSQLLADQHLGPGDFTIEAQLLFEKFAESEAAFVIGQSRIGLAAKKKDSPLFFSGPELHAGKEKTTVLEKLINPITEGKKLLLQIRREGVTLHVAIDGREVISADCGAEYLGEFGLRCGRALVQLFSLRVEGNLVSRPEHRRQLVAAMQPQIDTAIDRGMIWLLRAQQRDGSWGYREHQYRSGTTALCAYTLLKGGLQPEHLSLRRALRFMRRDDPRETYSVACHLMALEATHDPRHHPRMQELLDRLLSWQRGGWSYPNHHTADGWDNRPNVIDLSCTQFAALGLRAAHKAGLEIPRKAWLSLIKYARLHQEEGHKEKMPPTHEATSTGQQEVAGFFYRAAHGNSARSGVTASMTCAGIAVLAIAREVMGEDLPRRQKQKIEEGVERGLGWLGRNWSVHDNPGSTSWHYYYLYGLERVGSLLRIELIHQRSWYLEGARIFLGKQGSKGDWGGATGTCYAILFLRRATGMVSGSDPTKALGQYVCDDAKAQVGMRGLGHSPMALWITHFAPDVAEEHVLKIARVDYLVDGRRVVSVPGDPTVPWSSEIFRVEHHFRRPGKYQITALVHLAEPGMVLTSPGFKTDVRFVAGYWALREAMAGKANLLRGSKVTAKASSRNHKNQDADKVLDGLQSTRWICSKEDEAPALTVVLKRPVRARTIVLTQGDGRELQRNELDQILEVELRLNGKPEPHLIRFEPGFLRPTCYRLPKPEMIRGLEIRITDRKLGTRYPGRAGLAEVALELETVMPPAVSRDLDGLVTFRCDTEGASIHYTLVGTLPTLESPLYTRPFEWCEPTLLQARAFDDLATGDRSRITAIYLPAGCGSALLDRTTWRILDCDDASGAAGAAYHAIDGDPTTFWQSDDEPHPHDLQVDLGAEHTVTSVTYLPRQDAKGGRIKEFEVHLSTTETRWGKPAATGTFPEGKDLQTIRLDTPIKARYLRLTTRSTHDATEVATAAELDIQAKERPVLK